MFKIKQIYRLAPKSSYNAFDSSANSSDVQRLSTSARIHSDFFKRLQNLLFFRLTIRQRGLQII